MSSHWNGTFSCFDRVVRTDSCVRTIVEIGDVRIGGPEFVVMAGPCSVENERQIMETAEAVQKGGAHMLRGGAYKPRSSPYAFQGLGLDALCRRFDKDHDDYNSIMAKALADRLAEAFAEYLHKRVREQWGYGRLERLTNEELIREKVQRVKDELQAEINLGLEKRGENVFTGAAK